jgi:hypothetical protein
MRSWNNTGTVLGKEAERIPLISPKTDGDLSLSEYGIFSGKPQNCVVPRWKIILAYQVL